MLLPATKKTTTLKPSFVVSDYSCEVTNVCSMDPAVCSMLLWDGGQEHCVGNATFYRQLSQPTSEAIEMRVYRDQVQYDENLSLNAVEIYV